MRSIVFILAFVGCTSLFAQGFYNNGTIVSISPGTILSVPDSIVNKGTLINNGQIIISGAWINTGTYDAGTGQVDFDSDIDQVINHNAQSIEKLVISGGGKKQFLADIFIQSELTLVDGILESQNGARIVMDAGVVIGGGSDNSHILGPVERRGAGQWLYPIGNGTQYLPVVIASVSDASAFGIVSLHEITTEVLTTDATLGDISNQRYYELSSSGSLASSTITVSYNYEDLPGDPLDFAIAASNAATGPYSNLNSGAPTFKYYAAATVSKDKTIEIFNAVSVGSDGKNDFMTIRNIEFYPNNKLIIVNRWGDRVFEVSGYDNGQNVFKGYSNSGNRLPGGTYYYSLDLGDGSEKMTGYLVVR